MNNISITKSILSILLISSAVIFMNCTGKQGDPGPAGANGANATDGKDGSNGTDNPVYVDAISRGGMTISLSGTRPDGKAFSSQIDLPFSSTSLSLSSFYRYYADNDSSDDFVLGRYQGFNGTNYSDDPGVYFYFEPWVDVYGDTSAYFQAGSGGEGPASISVSFPSEMKYFNLSFYAEFQAYYGEAGDGPYYSNYGYVKRPTYSYSFDTATYTLKSNIAFTIIGDENSTGKDLKMTITTDALVYQSFQNNVESKQGRQKNGARQASTRHPATMPKAVMLDMK
jgi:hypothetical protein